jgi:2-polyprenyl-6-hydroxyphenyl methylase / 3-demethylubiquinone-9 3-methyltransferase
MVESANSKTVGSNDNVDAAEIAKFSALASRWWDPHSEFKPLHAINPLRLAHIERVVQQVSGSGLKGKRIVDIGCGGGILTESIAAKGATVVGLDMAQAPLSVAKLHALETGKTIDYRHMRAEDLADAEPASFDVVCCMEMLEHVPSPAATVAACAKLAKPGGTLVFSTINRNPKSFLFAIVGAEYVLRMLPKGTHEYRKFITPAELTGFAREVGIEVFDLTGMTFNPITQIYKLGKDVDVNYIIAAKKPAL